MSGNLSFLKLKENKIAVIDVIEELLKRKVRMYFLCRINIATMKNLEKLCFLMEKYPDLIEIKHCYQPLRGFIIDETLVSFKSDEKVEFYKRGELNKNLKIYYEITDPEWIAWLQKVFWNLFRFFYRCKYSNQRNEKIDLIIKILFFRC